MRLILASLLPLAALACSDDGGNAIRPTTNTAPDGGLPVTSDGGRPTYEESVPFTVVSDPDVACVTTAAAPIPVLREKYGARMKTLDALGDRRVAAGFNGEGFVTFGADGSSPSAAPTPVGADGRAAGGATGVFAVGIEGGNVVFRRFDANGAPASLPEALGPTFQGRDAFVAASGAKAVVVWQSPEPAVHARVFDGTKLGPDLVLEQGESFDDFSVAVAPSRANDGSDFLVLWALRRERLFAHRVYAQLVSGAQKLGLPRIVLGSTEPVVIRGATTRGATGAALLFDVKGEPHVAPLSALGGLTGAAHKLEGSKDELVGGGQGIAAQGDSLGVLVRHASGYHAFRALDAQAAPRGPWVCLDAPAPDELHIGGIIADGAGFTSMIATPNGGTAIVRTDAAGTGPL